MTIGGKQDGIALLILSMLLIAGCTSQSTDSAVMSEAAEARRDHPLLQYFIAVKPQVTVIKTAAGDVNNDGREDVIVIYNIAKDTNRMLVVLDLAQGYALTNEVPAPVSNQHIQFKDIDNKPPLEFIVRGAKGVFTGMAIYRVHDAALEDLFGEGMDGCCN